MNAWGLALITVALNVGAQVAVKLAAGNTMSPQMLVALALYGASFFFTFKIYAVNPLSLAAPLMAALTFMLTPLAAVVFLGETLGPARVVGLALILAGIVVVTRWS